MRYFYRIVSFLLFLLVLSFGLKNAQPVTIHYFLGLEWQAPLVLLLFLTLCVGVLLGMLACFSSVISHRRRRLALERELKKLKAAD